MPRQRIQKGAIVKIPTGDGYWTYGRLLRRPLIAVYDARTNREEEVARAISSPVLFVVAVYDHAITSGRWTKLSTVPLAAGEITVPDRFIQDPVDPRRCEIVDGEGATRSATIEECEGLEPEAVWEPEHVEERIRDYYAGRKNVWLESMKLQR